MHAWNLPNEFMSLRLRHILRVQSPFTKAVLLSIVGLLGFLSTIGQAAERTNSSLATRPNIILILADDLGYSDVGCYGSDIHTPNIDKLGYQGLRFAQFYNAARCCPTRASLLRPITLPAGK